MIHTRLCSLYSFVLIHRSVLSAVTALGYMAFLVKPSASLMSAMQHLAAGVVLSAVAVELLPVISNAPNDLVTTAAITTGFFLGIACFLLIGKFCSPGEAEDADADEAARDRSSSLEESLLQGAAGSVVPTVGKVTVMKRIAKERTPPFPVTLALAVGIDSFVDGFLIGLSSATGANAGIGEKALQPPTPVDAAPYHAPCTAHRAPRTAASRTAASRTAASRTAASRTAASHTAHRASNNRTADDRGLSLIATDCH